MEELVGRAAHLEGAGFDEIIVAYGDGKDLELIVKEGL
jgi:hypothetical protein